MVMVGVFMPVTKIMVVEVGGDGGIEINITNIFLNLMFYLEKWKKKVFYFLFCKILHLNKKIIFSVFFFYFSWKIEVIFYF